MKEHIDKIAESERTPIAKPRGAMRWKCWSLAGVFMTVSFYYLIPRKEPLDAFYIGLFCTIALLAALYTCREMWFLNAKRSPRWVGYAAAFGSAGAIVTLLVLHDLNLFRWNHLYFEWPFALLCGVSALGAWITEWRKRMRIYVAVEGFVFLPEPEPSNHSMQPTGQERPAAD